MGDSQHPLRLLSFDGGGIRGLSSLYLLRSIMKNLELEKGLHGDEHLLPCEVFDLMAGTSTGGLIAVMLGILRMDAQTCIDEYIKLAPKIFPLEGFVSRKSFVKASKLLLGRYRFDSLPLEQEMRSLVSANLKDSQSDGRSVHMRPVSGSDKCKVFVCANTEKHVKLTLFRNYSAPWDDSDDCEIWEACRATSAAPTFFPPISIGHPPVSYVDGALGHNNPIRSVLNEAKQLWPSRDIGCIISIGTGIPASVDSGRSLKLVETLKAISTEAEKTASQVRQEMENNYETHQNIYYRFNVQRGLEGVGLDEWAKVESIIVATREYQESQRSKIQACVRQILNPAEVSSKQLPQFRIPFSLRGTPSIGHFVPRPEELEEMKRCLMQSPMVNRRKVFVIHGLGGIGKTQLALEFARKYKDDFSATFWLQGETLESLKLSLAEAASWIRTNSTRNAAATANDATDGVEVLSREGLGWLSQEGNDRWLLIYDNCDTLASEENGYDLLSMFPETDHGSIIITTRRNQLSSLGTCQKMLQRMDANQSIALLESNIGQEFIVDEVSSWDKKYGLPLALAQAARYVRMTGSDIPGYFDLYDNSWSDLVKHMPDVQGYKYGSIQRTWTISFNEIKRQNLEASNLLQLMALFDCHDIWVDLIMNGNQGSDTPRWFRDITKSKVTLLSAIGHLFDFSLLQKATKADSYSMHPVVQQWVAMSMNENLAEFVQIAVAAIAFTTSVDHEPGFWMLQKRLLPHADKIYGFVNGSSHLAIDWEPRKIPDPSGTGDLARVVQKGPPDAQMEHPLLRLGWLYLDQQLFEKARSILQFGGDILQNTPGEEHPLVFCLHNYLAHVCNELGDFDKSESLATTTLDGYRKHFGDNSKWTFNALSCLSQVCFYRKNYKRAIELGEALLSIARKNPDVSTNKLSFSLNNLSVFYSYDGQRDKAIEMNQESLELQYKRLDPDHPGILKGLENLACRYMEVGSYTESERIFEKCIEGYQRAFGQNCLQAAREQELLARLYQTAGRPADAEELYRKVVEILENAPGAGREDIRTVRCVSNLCHLIFQKWEQAYPFGIDGPAGEPASLSDSALRQQLIELCNMMLNYPRQSDMLSYVAKMLFRYDCVDQSRVILQGQAKLKDGSWSYSHRKCDGIDSEHMIGTERFVCMVCDDLDLCRECMAVHKERELEGGECIGHPFLDVSLPSPANSTDYLEEAQKALRQILEDYPDTDKTTVDTSMAEGSQTKKPPPLEEISRIREVKGLRRSLMGRFKHTKATGFENCPFR